MGSQIIFSSSGKSRNTPQSEGSQRHLALVPEQAVDVTCMREEEAAFGCSQNMNTSPLWESQPQSKFIAIHRTLTPLLLVQLWCKGFAQQPQNNR